MLATALEDRGDVLCQHEMLHGFYSSTFGNGLDVSRKLYRRFWDHPQPTWDRSVFDNPYRANCDPRDLPAAGFILHRCMGDLIPKHPRLHHPNFGRGIWKLVEADTDVKIVFGHRENQFKRRLSEILADQGGRKGWQLYTKSRTYRRARINDITKQLLIHFRWYDEFYAAARELLRHHDSIEVGYEEMTEDLQGVMRGVQQFLGLDPVDVYPRTFKGEHRTLPKAIKNYGQVSAALRGTEFERFLDEAPESEVEARAKPTPKK